MHPPDVAVAKAINPRDGVLARQFAKMNSWVKARGLVRPDTGGKFRRYNTHSGLPHPADPLSPKERKNWVANTRQEGTLARLHSHFAGRLRQSYILKLLDRWGRGSLPEVVFNIILIAVGSRPHMRVITNFGVVSHGF
jgi:hypothetical protein